MALAEMTNIHVETRIARPSVLTLLVGYTHDRESSVTEPITYVWENAMK